MALSSRAGISATPVCPVAARRRPPVAARLVISPAVLAVVTVACAQPVPVKLSPPLPDEQIDLTPYVANPCPLIRPDRARRRTLVPPGSSTPVSGITVCRWTPSANGHPAITVQATDNRGLESVYRDRTSYGTFDPTAIAHYPTALTTGKGRTPADGVCTAQVGVGDNDLLAVTADYRGVTSQASSDPCLDADTVAFEIIQQIRSGNP